LRVRPAPGRPDLRVVFRVDASSSIGMGHLMRCIALGEAWESLGGKVTFITRDELASALDRLRNRPWDIHLVPAQAAPTADISMTVECLERYSRQSTSVVCDGYHFDRDMHHAIRGSGFPLLVIDDYGHLPFYEADFLLNQNSSAEEVVYRCPAETVPLLGTEYVLMSPEFTRIARQCNGAESGPPSRHRILVSLGGADVECLSERLTEAIVGGHDEDMKVTVVFGGGATDVAERAERLSRLPNVTVLANVRDMSTLFRSVDIAVIGCGSTVWECMLFGVPVVGIAYAENQEALLRDLCSRGIISGIQWESTTGVDRVCELVEELAADSSLRQVRAEKGLSLVDGFGAWRVCGRMLRHLGATCASGTSRLVLAVRDVEARDLALLLRWANEPVTRRNSFTESRISIDTHSKWFREKLEDDRTAMYVLEAGGCPAALARYEMLDEAVARVSYSVDHNFRGMKLGTLVLSMTTNAAATRLAAKRFRACTRVENVASGSCLRAAGYRLLDRDIEHGVESQVFELNVGPRSGA